MKNKTNYSVVKMTFEINDPAKKKKGVVYNKKINTIVRLEDREKVQQAFEQFVDSIEETQYEPEVKKKNVFSNLWRTIRGYSKASNKAYYRMLRS